MDGDEKKLAFQAAYSKKGAVRQALVAKLHVVGVENGEELQAPEDF